MKNLLFKALLICMVCVIFTPMTYAAERYHPLRFQITGLSNPAAQKNAETALENLRSHIHIPHTQAEMMRFYKKAPEIIQEAIQPYGFFRSSVQSSLVKTSENWMAIFQVTPGQPLPITSVHVEILGPGKTDSAFQKWQRKLPLHVGDAFQASVYDDAKLKLYNIATTRGYFQAKMITKEIKINLTAYHARIILIFNTGPRYRFGPTSFSNTPFYTRFLMRFLTYHEGELYDADKLEESKQGFIAGNLFDQVVINPDIKKAHNNEVPIHIALIPRKKREYTFGLGYGTDTGPRGTIGVVLRHLKHEGQRFRVLLRASQNNSGLTAKYLIPGWDPAHDLFDIGAAATTISQSTGYARNAKFSVAYSHTKGKWKNSISLAYLNERYNIVNYPNTSAELVYPTLSSKYFTANKPMNPSRGMSIEAQFAGASKAILSATGFTQLTTHFKSLYTFKPTHTRFLFRSDLGRTDITSLNNLPLSLQLFAGGSSSVRGYGINTIGPGRNLVVASTEVQQRVIHNWYVAGFIDAGVVGNQNLFSHINAGAGPGIVWITAIGAIELSYAEAFTQSNKPWTIHFSMGTVL